MKKGLLLFVMFSLAMLQNTIFAQNLNNYINVTLVSVHSESSQGRIVSNAGLMISNSSDCDISINSYIASVTETNESFCYMNPANIQVSANGIAFLTISRYDGDFYFLQMGGWTLEFDYTNNMDHQRYVKKVRKVANTFSTNMLLEDISEENHEDPQDTTIEGVEVDGLYYDLDISTKEAKIRNNPYSSYSGEIVIPASFIYNGDEYKVTAIKTGAFSNNWNVTSVSIPGSVKTIEFAAFSVCMNLNQLSIADGLELIENNAFFNCNGLTTVILPNSVNTIEEKAFYACYGLTTVILGSGISIIGYKAFQNCSKLSDVYCYAYNVPSATLGFDYYQNAILHVPASSLSNYRFEWSLFFNSIIALAESDPKPISEGVFKLTYIVDGQIYKSYDFEYGASITSEETPQKEGYTFSGWSDIPETMPNHDVTVTGTFTINKYKLIYKVDDEEYKSYDVDYNSAITAESVPTKEGFTFSGWSEIPETMPAHDVIVTGTFTVNKYKLTYLVDNEVYRSYDVEYGATITPEAAPTKENYIFSGWSDIPQTMPAHDVTVSGLFTYAPPKAYTLTYMVDGEVYKTVSYYEGDAITPEAEPTKEGYTFSGWSEIPETMPAEDVIVKGTFTVNQYILTYVLDGEVYKEYSYDYGSTITPEAEPTKEGYTFSGWSEIPETMPAKEVYVVGTFTINKYKITYVIDGEVYLTEEVEYGSWITPPNPGDHEGYDFAWEDYPDTMPAHDITINGTYTPTGIEAILASEPDVKIFTVSGKPLNKLQKGVNILRYKDGRTRKIVVK